MKNTFIDIICHLKSPFKSSLLLMGLLGVWSCKFSPNIQGEGTLFLQGKWKEIPQEFQKNQISYTLHQFKFSCDSFYMHLQTHAKVNYYSEACFNKGIWNEYAKGHYTILGDTLFLFGTFTKENYKQKISGCYRIGEYIEKFVIRNQKKDTLWLQSTTDESVFPIHLNQKIICNPKPL